VSNNQSINSMGVVAYGIGPSVDEPLPNPLVPWQPTVPPWQPQPFPDPPALPGVVLQPDGMVRIAEGDLRALLNDRDHLRRQVAELQTRMGEMVRERQAAAEAATKRRRRKP
jgi:hypothetical protein